MKLTRSLAAAGIAGALVLLGAPAFAHVTVNPDTAAQGSYTKLTFRVPNESDQTATTKVQVAFPTDHPIASVRTKPVPGWTAKIETTKPSTPLSDDDGPITQIVSTITWTADDAKDEIQPGQFQEFDVSAGPLPSTDSIAFRTLQTYSDGTVVRWIDPTKAGEAEPEHPAAVLTLTPAAAEDQEASASTSGSSSATIKASTSHQSSDSKTPLILSVIALVVAVLGAGASLLRKRS